MVVSASKLGKISPRAGAGMVAGVWERVGIVLAAAAAGDRLGPGMRCQDKKRGNGGGRV